MESAAWMEASYASNSTLRSVGLVMAVLNMVFWRLPCGQMPCKSRRAVRAACGSARHNAAHDKPINAHGCWHWQLQGTAWLLHSASSCGGGGKGGGEGGRGGGGEGGRGGQVDPWFTPPSHAPFLIPNPPTSHMPCRPTGGRQQAQHEGHFKFQLGF